MYVNNKVLKSKYMSVQPDAFEVVTSLPVSMVSSPQAYCSAKSAAVDILSALYR